MIRLCASGVTKYRLSYHVIKQAANAAARGDVGMSKVAIAAGVGAAAGSAGGGNAISARPMPASISICPFLVALAAILAFAILDRGLYAAGA